MPELLISSVSVIFHQRRKPDVQKICAALSPAIQVDESPVPLVHILQLLTHFKCEPASTLLCNELCFTLGQGSAKWCACLEKAQLKNVRLML